MEEVNARFRQFVEKVNLAPTRFAAELGVNHQSINRMYQDNTIMPSGIILFLSKKRWPNLNVNYLLTGEDRMWLDVIDSMQSIKVLEDRITTLLKSIDEKDEIIGQLSATIRNLSDQFRTKNKSKENLKSDV